VTLAWARSPLVVVAVLAALVALAAVRSKAPLVPPAGATQLPRAAGPIAVDGEVDDPGWLGPVYRTGAFSPERPHAEARMTWDARDLFVALYAADHDVRVSPNASPDAPLWKDGDEFRVVIGTAAGEHVIEVAPSGVVTDARRPPWGGELDVAWQSGARTAHDVDGTIDDPRDDDEEWVIEMAVPLASLGLTGRPGEWLRASVRRCDAERTGARTCTSSPETLLALE